MGHAQHRLSVLNHPAFSAGPVIELIAGTMFGGGQRHVLDLMSALRSEGRCAVQCWTLGGDGYLGGVPVDQVIPTYGAYNQPLHMLRHAHDLRRALNATDVALLHSHGWDATLTAWVASRGRRMPHVASLHITPEFSAWRGPRAGLRKALMRRVLCDPCITLVAVAEAVASHWREGLVLGDRPIHVVHNGVALPLSMRSATLTEAPSAVRLGIVSRLAEGKGIEQALAAVAVLHRAGESVHLTIAGSGPLDAALRAEAERLGIAPVVRFAGFVRDVPGLLGELDLLLLPSSREGLPIIILEALATGLPVISSAVGGVPEIIEDAVSGLLVPPGDVAALVLAIRRLLHDPHQRAQIGKAGRQRVEQQFTIAHCAQRLAEVYGVALRAAAA
jgi:glycosyltransferase involved in cell wall biosynthesis